MKPTFSQLLEENNAKNTTLSKKIIQSVIMSAFLLCVLLFSIFSYAWFANNGSSGVTGLNVTVSGLANITVVPGSGPSLSGDRVSVTVVPEEYTTDNISDPTRMKKISPDSYGQFSFLITSSINSYDLTTACVVDDSDYKGTVDTAEEKVQYTKYLNSHILFFESYENDVFSGWIQPGTTEEFSITPNVESEITIHWVWISSFVDMLSGSGKISANDATRIGAYINNGYFDNFFDTRRDTEVTSTTANPVLLKRYYDNVDENIGSGIDKIHFEVTFSV